MNVVIAIDSSATAQAALAATLARKWPERTQFRILTVLPDVSKRNPSIEQKHSQLAKAHRLIERATSLIEAENPDSVIVGHIDVGTPATSILALAKSWPADLIIVGSHDRGPFERLMMGSVSRKVLESAPCSVLVARNFDCFLNRVLIAIDGSVSSNSVVNQVLQTNWPEDTHFHLLTVVDPPAIATFEPSALVVSRQLDLHKQNIENAQTMLEDAATQIEGALARDCVTYSVAQGQARQAILQAAQNWQADLIVTGSRGLTGWERRVLGSVSKDVATSADCSVQIIRSNVIEMTLPESNNYTEHLPSATGF